MISLILATLGRYKELDQCIESILTQINVEFEVLIIDQNSPEFLRELRSKYVEFSNIFWKNISSIGLSNARNEGLALARYDFIALIDDDSILQNPCHLQTAIKWLNKYDFVSGICVNYDGTDANRFFPSSDECISNLNVFFSIMSPCFFFRHTKNLKFDVRLGVGAYFGSAEETDFAVLMLQNGSRGYFTRTLSVIHPEGDSKQLSADRRYRYALGVGALMRKRSDFFGIKIVIQKLFGPLLKGLKYFVTGHILKSRLALTDFRGRLLGFLSFNAK